MAYVDAFVVPVPKKNIEPYKALAKKMGSIWREYGALEYHECVADDVKPGKVTSFPQSVLLKEDETVVFSWIVYKSRKHRDQVNAKVMKDPRIAKMTSGKSMPFDVKRMRHAVRLAVRLAQNQAFQGLITARLSPSDADLATDEALDHWLLANVSTTHHLAGTCKMGPTADPMAVVDQYCRVHGLQGLRVVDASVMPDVVRANTNATTIMIAERAADLMR